jgi:hypothetical protein
MNLSRASAIVAVVAALVVAPAGVLASPPANPGAPDNQGTQTAATHTSDPASQPGPNASLPAKAKAYGRYCQNQSKTHVAGQHGTPFSQCVTAMAKLASGTNGGPTSACASLSRQHVAGQRGTPYSQCVTAAALLLKDQHAQSS